MTNSDLHVIQACFSPPPPLQAHNRQATNYLEYCVHTLRVTEPAIHNFLISMYVDQGLHDELIKYFKSQGEVRGFPTWERPGCTLV